MREFKLLLPTILLLQLFSFTTFSQDTITIDNVTDGLVDYDVTASDSTHLFILYGDGHFGMHKDVKHKFPASSNGYVTEAFFAKAYDSNVPTLRTIGTGTIGTGSTYSNPAVKMSGEIDLLTSWATAFGYENYFIIAFTNENSASAVDGCIEFHYDSDDITINTSGIKIYNTWVRNQSTGASSKTGYDKKMKWDFKGLKKGETRYVYVPAKVKVKAGKKFDLYTSYKVNCSGSGSSSGGSSSFLSRNNPHDPNFKYVDRDCLRPFMPENTLEYTIGFFNDGTGYAHNVFLQDTLSDWLLESTVGVIDYEFQPYSIFMEPELLIDFMGINLPGTNQHNSSTNTYFSYEDAFTYVTFRVCTQAMIPDGSLIKNRVSIVFDTQPAYLTKYARTVIDTECTLHVPCMSIPIERSTTQQNDLSPTIFQAHPNPFNHQLKVSITTDEASDSRFDLEIMDYSGKVVKQLYSSKTSAPFFQKQFFIDDLPKGMYILVLHMGDAIHTQKIIKL